MVTWTYPQGSVGSILSKATLLQLPVSVNKQTNKQTNTMQRSQWGGAAMFNRYPSDQQPHSWPRHGKQRPHALSHACLRPARHPSRACVTAHTTARVISLQTCTTLGSAFWSSERLRAPMGPIRRRRRGVVQEKKGQCGQRLGEAGAAICRHTR